jgi:glycosyltransferase involved in cell wall biosynthesis
MVIKNAKTTVPFEDNLNYRFFPTWSHLLISPQMVKWFNNNLPSYDIVHVHGLYRFPVTTAAYCARKAQVPYIIMPHGALDPFLYKQSQYGLLLKRIYERLFDIPNLNHATAIHYTAEEEAKQASFLKLNTKPVIVPNGIDWEGFLKLPSKGNFRRRIGLDFHSPLILFLGRINFKKGLDLLVPAFKSVSQKHADARIAFVGPDNDGYGADVRRWCREQCVHDKVFFIDHLGFEDVKEAYVDADLFVLPSYTENFGLTVVEAMACGTPVVISDQVNIWRDILASGAGLVVRLDIGELADAICLLLADKRSAEAMGARGRVSAQTDYAWPRIVEQLKQVYQELIETETTSRGPLTR